MPKPLGESRPKGKVCSGGSGLFREHSEHLEGGVILCFRCKARVGCTRCFEVIGEAICGNCQDYANLRTLRDRGHIVQDREASAEALKIVTKIVRGSISMEDGAKLIDELIASKPL